ncbi:MAG: hypothetical protein QF893_22175, partial [Alphaproteobacteria bacterium]|nr:hypothetical protein [Alphaproteobacteria bacterium]
MAKPKTAGQPMPAGLTRPVPDFYRFRPRHVKAKGLGPMSETADGTYDVVVVGCGIAGLAAAVTAL